MNWLSLGLVAAAPAAMRWLRVAQREHYLPGAAARFAIRWWMSTPANVLLAMAGLIGLAVTPWWGGAALIPAAIAAAGPIGLGMRGRSAPLAWTARLRRVAGLTGVLVALLGVAGLLFDLAGPTLALATLGLPVVVDLALLALQPVERVFGSKWIETARRKLEAIRPRVIAITGSYGKTTTKEYLRLLLAGRQDVVASPASFNNAMGLARTINENLTPGTGVLIAEMGTYGIGEIADLCSWIPPEVGVITAIGPVHLERFGSLDTTLRAKAEILERATTAVLNVDDPRLAALAGARSEKQQVVRCSAQDVSADVCVLSRPDGQEVLVGGRVVGLLNPPVGFPTNVACAIGAALAVGLDERAISAALGGADRPAHRQTLSRSDLGFTIIDDTYNSNPAGAATGLELLVDLGREGRRVLVTPGMVELGSTQFQENHDMARHAAEVVTEVVVVGKTNRAALVKGAEGGSASVIVVDDRRQAVDWVRANLSTGDVVLYENDLPDHYP